MANTAARGTPADGETRRDFLFLATGAVGAVGGLVAIWPLIDQMNPAADVQALATTDVDLTPIAAGQSITVVWRGKPVFVRHRTEAEITDAQNTDWQGLPDPEPDAERVIEPQWLIVVGVCTHLGCIPLGYQGDYNGWFCPCHGSHYDKSGRIRSGPAPLNLAVPTYQFLDDTTIRIG